jgi:2'-5' RNA ligase
VSSGALRLFVALELPGGAAAELAGWGRAAAPDGVRPVPAANLHVTLAFLGACDAADAAAAADVVRTCAPREPIALRTAGALWLPPRRPGVLTVALAPVPALLALHEAVGAALRAALAWAPERRPFRPHVTVGRVRRGARVRPGEESGPPPALDVDAPALALLCTVPAPDGSGYERLASVPCPARG